MKKLYLILFFTSLYCQPLDVTFRYVKNLTDDFDRVYVPGTMPSGNINDWGPNSNGIIEPNAPSQMIYNEYSDSYDKSYSLMIGEQYLYKIHFHYNNSGTNYAWISDPLNPLTTNDNYENSILNVTDPLLFQPVKHTTSDGMVDGLSVGIFTNGNIDQVICVIGSDTIDTQNALNDNGVFYVSLDPPRSLFESFFVEAIINSNNYIIINQPEIEIDLFKKQGTGFEVTDGSEYFSEYLKKAVRLMRIKQPRTIKPECHIDGAVTQTGFADGFPLLLASENSLQELNSHIEQPISIDSFRANLVVKGAEAYDEDYWREIRIGSLRAYDVRACARCPIPNIDQTVGELPKERPVTTALRHYRSGIDPISNSSGEFFGQNLTHVFTPGQTITVDDRVEILRRSHERNFRVNA